MADETQGKGSRVSRRRVILGGLAGVLPAMSRTFFWRRSCRFNKTKPTPLEPLELSFSGPFSYNQALINKKTGNAWASVHDLYFPPPVFGCLGIAYQFRDKKEPSRKLHIVITATAKNGTTYTLLDGMRTDVRLDSAPKLRGSGMTIRGNRNTESLRLPVEPSEITELNVSLAMDND
ncbi:MAG: hypothetical protein NTW96_18480 [Planctomycetia bacterium]|nr:hypothetical protein [Planctomycetia bacterium]